MRISERSNFPWRFVIAAAWTALILVACWLPSRRLPIPETGRSGLFKIPHLDKIVHFTMFAGFGFLWMRAVASKGRAGAILVVGVFLAIISELGQDLPIVGRDSSILDTLADIVGLSAAVGFKSYCSRENPGPAESGESS